MFLLFVFFFYSAANEAGETPLDIARRLKHVQCEELVSFPCFNFTNTCICVPKPSKNCRVMSFFGFYSQLNQALAGKFNAHVHVEYEWCLQHEDLDESDEDLDEKVKSLGENRYIIELDKQIVRKRGVQGPFSND